MDCGKCRRMYPRLARQMMRCGFEPPLDVETMSIRPMAWAHQAYEMPLDENGQPVPPSTCPGYTCSLPDVLEVARARLHWDKGVIGAFTAPDAPTEALLRGIEVLEIESRRVEAWLSRPAKDGGGGP